MRKWIASCILLAIVVSATEVNAFRLFRRRSSGGNNYSSSSVNPGSTYQAQAQYKANLLAKLGTPVGNGSSHRVSALVGSFEGVGWGAKNCATCTPRGRMTLVADAVAWSTVRNRWYRVRAWR